MVIDKIQRVVLSPSRSPGPARASYRSIFISPARQFGGDYDRLIKMLNQGLGLNQWQNLAAEQNYPVNLNGEKLAAAFHDLIGRADALLVLSGLYPHFGGEIQKEMTIATGLGIPVIAVVPWGQESSPQPIRNLASQEVAWVRKQICDAVNKGH